MSVINCLSVRIWLYQTPSLSRQCMLCLTPLQVQSVGAAARVRWSF